MRKYLSYSIITVILLLTAWILNNGFHPIVELYFQSAKAAVIPVFVAMTAYLLLFPRALSFYENFIHELTHMIFAMLFLDDVKQFFASQTHGELVTGSTRINLINATSPYFFPLISFSLIAFLSVLSLDSLMLLVPISYGFFLAIVVKQVYKHSRELKEFGWMGIPFALAMTFWVSFIILSWYAGDIGLLKNTIKTLLYEFN